MRRLQKRKKPVQDSHREDILVSSDILKEARAKGHILVQDTLDGDLDIYFDKDKRNYKVTQTFEGKVVSYIDVLRHDLQSYLIELREQKRVEDKKHRRR